MLDFRVDLVDILHPGVVWSGIGRIVGTVIVSVFDVAVFEGGVAVSSIP